MATTHLPPDFREFFRLLDANRVEYLLVGGYAVGYHGYPRATVDLDIWVAISPDNAHRLLVTLEQFGFGRDVGASMELLTQPGNVIRMGLSPLRIEIQTIISGVSFTECYARRVVADLDGTPVSIISVGDLKINKRAAGRLKDLNDLENLP
jgi:hypothetical protein